MELLDRIDELCKEKGITRRKMETEAGLSTGSTSRCTATAFTLKSFNPNYEPMYFSNQGMLDKPMIIIGKVIELRGKFS